MLSNIMICSPKCVAQSLLGFSKNIKLHQYCRVHTVHTVLIEFTHGKSSPDLSCFPDWLHLLLYSYPYFGWAF